MNKATTHTHTRIAQFSPDKAQSIVSYQSINQSIHHTASSNYIEYFSKHIGIAKLSRKEVFRIAFVLQNFPQKHKPRHSRLTL